MGTPTLNSIPFKSPGDLREYVVFDLETTGLHPKTCQIIQLAAVRSEVERLAKRRDAITAQIGALRDVVAGFAEDES